MNFTKHTQLFLHKEQAYNISVTSGIFLNLQCTENSVSNDVSHISDVLTCLVSPRLN